MRCILGVWVQSGERGGQFGSLRGSEESPEPRLRRVPTRGLDQLLDSAVLVHSFLRDPVVLRRVHISGAALFY